MMKNTPKRDGDSYCFFMTTLIKKNTSFYKTLNIAGYLLTGIISLFLLTYMKQGTFLVCLISMTPMTVVPVLAPMA